MRNVGLFVLLVTLWILAWGEITLANLLTGVIATAALLIAFPPRRGRGDLHYNAGGVFRFATYVVAQLVTSNISMSRYILRRDSSRRPGVLEHRLRRPSEEVATVMSSVIALSPGTMTVDVARDSSAVYVHFFDLRDVDAARASLARLEQVVLGESPNKEKP